MMNYSPHGKSEITVEHNLMLIEAYGSWNEEYMVQFHQQLLEAAVLLTNLNNYGIVINLHGQALITEQGIHTHIEFIKQGHTKAIAINMADCLSLGISQNILTKLYRAADIKHQFFTTHSDAKAWVLEQLHN